MRLKVNWLHVVLGVIAILAVSYVTFAATPAPPVVTSQDIQLTLVAPTSNTDKTALTNFAGFRLYHRLLSTTTYDPPVLLSVMTSKYSLASFGDGQHAYAVSAINSTGQESAKTAEVMIAVRSVAIAVSPNKPASPITVKVTS